MAGGGSSAPHLPGVGLLRTSSAKGSWCLTKGDVRTCGSQVRAPLTECRVDTGGSGRACLHGLSSRWKVRTSHGGQVIAKRSRHQAGGSGPHVVGSSCQARVVTLPPPALCTRLCRHPGSWPGQPAVTQHESSIFRILVSKHATNIIYTLGSMLPVCGG